MQYYHHRRIMWIFRCRDCKARLNSLFGKRLSINPGKFQVNVHKKCCAFLPMNCHIPAEGDSNLTPTLERMSVNETGREIFVIPAGDQQGNQVEEMDTMIPLARLPGIIAFPTQPRSCAVSRM